MSLIFSRRPDNAALTLDQIRAMAPAAFSTQPSPDVSHLYGQVSTLDVVDVLADYGWQPVQAAQKKGRTVAANNIGQHLIAFAQQQAEEGHDRPEIVLYNSHDGLSSLRLFAGWFRFICSNGMVAGEGFEQIIRHHRANIVDVEDMVRKTAQTLPSLSETVAQMKAIRPEPEQRAAFLRHAAALRWEVMDTNKANAAFQNPAQQDVRGSFAGPSTVSSLADPVRHDDAGPDLWRMFNVSQERLIRGGVPVLSFTDRNPMGKVRMARPVAGVDSSVRVNRGLWDLANGILEAA